MRHGRGADLVLGDLLVEIFHGDVGPDVAAQINQNRVDAAEAVEDGRKVVVVVNLGGRERSPEAQRSHEPVGESRPVDVRESDLMGVHITGRAAELGWPSQLAELAKLLVKP